jgi:hypothetical protein
MQAYDSTVQTSRALDAQCSFSRYKLARVLLLRAPHPQTRGREGRPLPPDLVLRSAWQQKTDVPVSRFRLSTWAASLWHFHDVTGAGRAEYLVEDGLQSPLTKRFAGLRSRRFN